MNSGEKFISFSFNSIKCLTERRMKAAAGLLSCSDKDKPSAKMRLSMIQNTT